MPVQESLVFDGDTRKARGAFFTPPILADFLANWAVRKPSDRVLDPSCGEAALLLAAGRRLRSLGRKTPTIAGFDLHLPSIEIGRQLLKHEGNRTDLRQVDFFAEPSRSVFDAIVGNPPYIRYQAFAGDGRIKAQQAALAQGVRLSGLANAWAAFVVHSSSFLTREGRMALVLPAVLLSVNYAAPVRKFLLQRFGSVKLVMFDERVFPDVQEEVVVLLAEGSGGTPRFEVYQVKDLHGLTAIMDMPAAEARPWTPTEADDKWTEALLPSLTASLYSSLTSAERFTSLISWGDPDLGMVTGNNKFFTLTTSEANNLGISKRELLRISPPGSSHLRGLTFTDSAFDELAQDGKRSWLFHPSVEQPSKAASDYIKKGENEGVHLAYKCAVRTPWWRVPGVRIPDLFLTYMNQDAPRLVSNDAKAAHLNSVHGVTLRPEVRKAGVELLPLAMLNSVTLLSAELVGRSYGGGLLKLEPREAESLSLPSPELLTDIRDRLIGLRPQTSKHLRNNHLREIVKMVDQVILIDGLGLKPSELDSIHDAHRMMAARRSTRAGSPQ